MSKREHNHNNSDSAISASSSIGQLLRAQFAMNNGIAEEKPKTVGFNESENMRLYELYSARREEYHSTRPSGQRNEEVPMDTLAREWAHEITSMGFAERTPAQIKQRIRDMRKFSRKHAHKLGITGLNGSDGATGTTTEFSWAETKRRSRGPVPDWMSGLAQIMMSEQEKQQEESESTTDVMEAAFGQKAKRLKMQQKHELHLLQTQLQLNGNSSARAVTASPSPVRESVSRDRREMSPETALIEKKLELADAKLQSEKLRQQALRLEIAYYERQNQIYDEQFVASAAEILKNSQNSSELMGLVKMNGLNK